LGGDTITSEELIPSARNLAALGSLYHSVVSSSVLGHTGFHNLCKDMAREGAEHPESCAGRFLFAYYTTEPSAEHDTIYSLPSSIDTKVFVRTTETPTFERDGTVSETIKFFRFLKIFRCSMTRRFQALLKTYEQLAELVLNTIRIDVRCRAIHYLESSMRHVSFCYSSSA